MASEDRLGGVLLGTAIGDALGLPVENFSPRRIARKYGRLDRYRLLGRTGFISDDTEQSALVAHSLARHPDDLRACLRDFAGRLVGWFFRLPFAIGRATLAACLKLCVGISPERSGIDSAGNGAAMRAAVVGVFFDGDPARRREFTEALSRVTHVDRRAVEGAVFVAEAAARLAGGSEIAAALAGARGAVSEPSLGEALDRALALAARGGSTAEATDALKTTGFVLHTVPFAAFCLARHGDDPRLAIEEAANAGGDTDTNAAVVGALVGARHGAARLPRDLVDCLEDGPLGRTHLIALARSLHETSRGECASVPSYSSVMLFIRNALLFVVVLGHIAKRLVP